MPRIVNEPTIKGTKVLVWGVEKGKGKKGQRLILSSGTNKPVLRLGYSVIITYSTGFKKFENQNKARGTRKPIDNIYFQ